jgi:hypothetical protein
VPDYAGESESPSTTIERDHKRSAWASFGETLLIFLVFFVIGGAPAPHVNEPHYLCRLKHYWNPAWCPGDLFLDSPEAHLVFVWAFGWLTRWLSLDAFAWLGRIGVWLALAWAWQRLSWQLVARPLCSVLSAALFVILNLQGHAAGEWVVGGFEAKCVAYVFVLCGLTALASDRWNKVWICLGIASAFHALVGGWSVLLCLGIWLAHGRQDRPFQAILPGMLVGGMIAFAGIVPALLLTQGQAADVVAEANRIYVFERLSHHLAPLTLPTDEVIDRWSRHALLLLALLLLGAVTRRIDQSRRASQFVSIEGLALVWWFAWGAALLAGIGLVIEVALWNHPLLAARLLKFYWFRMTDVAAALAVALHLTALLTVGIMARRPWAAWSLGLALLLVCWQLADFALDRVRFPVPPADAKMRDYGAWVDVCHWVTDNTPRDALFLTPRMAQTFKWRTGRSEFVTRKDIPQDASSLVEWFARLRRAHYYHSAGEWYPYRSLAHGGTGRIEQLAKEYRVDYVVTDARRSLGLPVVYRNEEYVVYVTGHLR